MSHSSAGLPAGTRLTDHISLGVIAQAVPLARTSAILADTGTGSRRQRDLPAPVVVYYTMGLALYMTASTREVLRCLRGKLTLALGRRGRYRRQQERHFASSYALGRPAIGASLPANRRSPRHARHARCLVPALACGEPGWLVPGGGRTQANEDAFGRPPTSWGATAFPQLRFVALVENGTHVLLGAGLGPYSTGELTFAHDVVPTLRAGMLCLADCHFPGYEFWQKAGAAGADLVWRTRTNARLDRDQVLADGSYLSSLYASTRDRPHRRNGIVVRAIDYQLEGIDGAEPIYRLVTTILDPQAVPAAELAAPDQERWETEGALEERKTHLRGGRIGLRSKTPSLVRQECWGLLLAHYAVRGLMHEAALKVEEDPDQLSFLHAVRVIRCKRPLYAAFSPCGPSGAAGGRAGRNSGRACGEQPRAVRAAGVRHKMSNYALRPRDSVPTRRRDYRAAIRVLK